MNQHARAFRLAFILLLLAGLLTAASGCATKGYVRQETQRTAATLSTRIDENEKSIAESNEQIRAANNQITELASLNKQNSQKIETLNSDVQRVDGRAGQARTAADHAQQTADGAAQQVSALDTQFDNRHRYSVALEKAVYFPFDSARLESSYHQDLIEVANSAKGNSDAIVSVEGRADSSGDSDYNIRLGERRMEAVVRFLVVEQGVPIHRVFKMSFGSAQPVSDNDSREGRAKNRCAIVRVLTPGS